MRQKKVKFVKERVYLVLFESIEGCITDRVFTGTFEQVYKCSLGYCSDKWSIREIRVL